MTTPPDEQVEHWLRRRTTGPVERDLARLVELKQRSRSRVSVCLPTLDEAATIGSICRSIARDLVKPGIVDELLVVDSASSDATREIAADAGAALHEAAEILPELPPGVDRPGKGEALWKSLAVSSGDIIVWLDSDVRNFSPQFVARLLWPLLEEPELVMTKAFYERPLEDRVGDAAGLGGRVTELGARPLLQLLWPRLAGVIQPLSGEYALRRAAALEIPFVTGYGVDVGILIDVAARYGIDAIAQVDLGVRVHRNRDLLTLGRTSFQVLAAILLRLRALGELQPASEPASSFLQFEHPSLEGATTSDVEIAVRPPMGSLVRS